MSACVAIDIGNTSVTVARVQGRRATRVRRLPTAVRDGQTVESLLRDVLGGREAAGAVVGSVVPAATRRWTRAARRVLGVPPVVVDHRCRLGVGIDYPEPASIGADRLANACGARLLYGAPVVVADFGTALTFDIVDKEGRYLGGVICPGLPLMIDYLVDRTALLPRIRLPGAVGRVGRSTAGAMRIGAQVGYRGIVREVVDHVRRQPGMSGAALCATGGHAGWVLKGLALPFRFAPALTLIGLGVIYDLNHA